MMMLMKIMNMTHVLSLRHKEETTLIPVQKLHQRLLKMPLFQWQNMTESERKKRQLINKFRQKKNNDKVSITTEATLENCLEYDNEKESTEGSGIVETYDA